MNLNPKMVFIIQIKMVTLTMKLAMIGKMKPAFKRLLHDTKIQNNDEVD